jgi:hypothetical protein
MAYEDVLAAVPGVSCQGIYLLDETSGSVAEDAHTTNLDLTIGAGVVLDQAGLHAASTKSFGFTRAANSNLQRSGVLNPDFSIVMSFRFSDVTTQRQAIFHNGGATNGFGIVLNGAGQTDQGLYLLYTDESWYKIPDITIAVDTNYHLIFSRQANGLVYIWLNGVRKLEAFRSAPVNVPTTGMQFGCEDPAGGSGMIGRLDDIAIYNGGISEGDFLAIYNAATETVVPPVDLDAAWFNYARERSPVGAQPYSAITGGIAPGASEHYDAVVCSQNARDYYNYHGEAPADWDPNINNAITRWRDNWVLLYGEMNSVFKLFHGFTRHYLETGDTESRRAVNEGFPQASFNCFDAEQLDYYQQFMYPFYYRENAFLLASAIDRLKCGLPAHHENTFLMLCDWLIEGMYHFSTSDEERWGVYRSPFMIGLNMRSLVYFWFHFRDSASTAIQERRAAIVPALEAMCPYYHSELFWPVGQNVPIAFEGAFWDKGGIKYRWPDPASQSAIWTDLGPFTVTSVSNPQRQFIASGDLSSVDDYYKYARVFTSSIGVACTVRGYNGTTKEFTVRGTFGNPNIQVGHTFTLHAEGWDDGNGAFAPSGAMPMGNPLASPGFAFLVWYFTFVEPDPAKVTAYRAMYDELWYGQTLCYKNVYTQKEWNESLFWGINGEGFIYAAEANEDTDFDPFVFSASVEPVATYSFVRSGAASGPIGQATGNLTVTLGPGTVAAPITFTFGLSGVTGSYSAPTVILDGTTRSGSVTFTPTSDGTATFSVTNNGSLPNPANLTYTVNPPETDYVEDYTWVNQGASSGQVGSPSGTLRIELGDGQIDSWVQFTFAVSGVTGSFSNPFRNLNNTFRWGETTFIPTSAGVATLSVTNNGGLPNPDPISYTVTASEGSPPLVPVGVPEGTQYPVIMVGNRVSWIVPWDGKP